MYKKGSLVQDGYNAFSYETCIMTRGADGKAILNVTQNFQQTSGTLALQIDGTQADFVRVPFADTSTYLIPAA